jgi:hypothetical protein
LLADPPEPGTDKQFFTGIAGHGSLSGSYRHSGRRGAAIRNLEIPGSRFARPGMTADQSFYDKIYNMTSVTCMDVT